LTTSAKCGIIFGAPNAIILIAFDRYQNDSRSLQATVAFLQQKILLSNR